MQPTVKPKNPNFSSGPCSKRPGYNVADLQLDTLGRSHRSALGKKALGLACSESARVLGLPEGYRVAVVAGSDTGAMEMALWSLLGPRGVDVLAWESFGSGWVTDIVKQLKIKDTRVLEADYGKIVDLAQVDFTHDVIFTWNGTTSGVRVPDGEWIPGDREGLTICDATSAAFAVPLPWARLDVVTYSWQKVLGGEAQHGVLVLGPRAIERLESYVPPWPLPKIFRLTKGGRLIEGIFKGETINTPSMLAVEDQLDALAWAESIGGAPALHARVADNAAAIAAWVGHTAWVDYLARRPATRSPTSVCLRIVDSWFTALAVKDQAQAQAQAQAQVTKRLVALLEEEGVAFDVGAYRDAPPGLRIWAGATVERADLDALFPWLDWAYASARAQARAAA